MQPDRPALDWPEPDRPEPDRPTSWTRQERHPRSRGFPSKIKDHGSWIEDGIKYQRSRIVDQRPRIKDQGSKIKDQGSSIQDQGPRIGSTIKDQRSRIKDHGPCFGTNEHPRRDTGVILRLSKCTIVFLSFYIGFGTLSRVKMMVFDKYIDFE